MTDNNNNPGNGINTVGQSISEMKKELSDQRVLINKLVAMADDLKFQIGQSIVLINAQIARFDVLEKDLKTGININSKRSIKYTSTPKDDDSAANESELTENRSESSKTVSNTKGRKREVVSKEPVTSKVIRDAPGFFKYMVLYNNYNDMRNKYMESIQDVKENAKGKEGTMTWWVSIGSILWKIFQKDQKDFLSAEFKTWRDTVVNGETTISIPPE